MRRLPLADCEFPERGLDPGSSAPIVRKHASFAGETLESGIGEFALGCFYHCSAVVLLCEHEPLRGRDHRQIRYGPRPLQLTDTAPHLFPRADIVKKSQRAIDTHDAGPEEFA